MPCYRPLTAYRTAQGSVVFSELRRHGDFTHTLQLPCGQCVGCRLERSRQWAVRCVHEAQMHDENCFLTLTYSPENLPKGRTLVYSDVQKFLKRLRRWFKKPVRFYMCGEYGEQLDRPHYHLLLFGCQFPDLQPFRTGGSHKLCTSAILERLWGLGFCTIGQVTFESAAYTARYIMKKVTGDLSKEHYRYVDPDTGEVFDRVPEFNHMSLKPGIGSSWFDRFSDDVYPDGMVVARGHPSRSPRYYDKLVSKLDPEVYDELLYEREVEGRSRFADNSEDRLKVRETVATARISQLTKTL